MKHCYLLLSMMGLFLILMGCQNDSQKGENLSGNSIEAAQLTSSVDRAIATPGDLVRFEVQLVTDAEFPVTIPQVGDQIAALQGIRLEDEGYSGPIRRSGRYISTRWYDIRADLVGSYLLPAVKMSVQTPQEMLELKTPAIFFEVKSVLTGSDGEGEVTGQLRDIKPLAQVPGSWSKKALWIGSGLGVLAMGLALVFWARRWSQKPVAIETISPDQQALNQLNHLKQDLGLEWDLSHEEIRKTFYFRLSEIFRTYLEKRFQFQATDLTTEEILPRLQGRPRVSSEIFSQAKQFLQDTDLVKFTDILPRSGDPERLWKDATTVVRRTRSGPELETQKGEV